jgi:ferrous iron transport protein A
MMPLSMAEHGKELEIKRINGKDDTRRFLETLGFVEGSNVRIVSKMGGNLIVSVKESRIAIDKAMANRVMV